MLRLQSLQRAPVLSALHDAKCSLQGPARVRGPDRGHGARKQFGTSYLTNLQRRQANASISDPARAKGPDRGLRRGSSSGRHTRRICVGGTMVPPSRSSSRSWTRSGTWCVEAVRDVLPDEPETGNDGAQYRTLGLACAHGPDQGLGAWQLSGTSYQMNLQRGTMVPSTALSV